MVTDQEEGMHRKRRWPYSVGMLAFVWSLGLSLPPAQAAHISCGDVLGPGGNFVLDSDVGPCSGPGPALTVISASLDLAGHTVSCSTLSIYGIEVKGKGSRVRDGVVSGCSNGVVLLEQGGHDIREVTASENVTGFTVGSSRNTLTKNTATDNEYAGFAVGGSRNQLSDNTTSGSEFGFLFIGAARGMLSHNTATGSGDGFEMYNSDDNLLTSNAASGNTSGGFHGTLSANNRWEANTASGNAEGFAFEGDTNGNWIGNTANGNLGFGFNFADGVENSLNDNHATGNGNGFGIEETNDSLLGNEAVDNTGAGFTLFADAAGVRLRNNKALSNDASGIHLNDGATSNRLRTNQAFDNGDFDLQDDNLGCDANDWSSNNFGTANQGCID
jgi:parallel beta-helix repeat protein